MKNNNPIDELFKKGLEGHTTKPSAAAWEKVAAGLEQKEGRKGVFMLRAAVITLLIGLSSVMYFNNNSVKLINIEPAGPSIVNNDDPKSNTATETPSTNPEKEKTESPEKSSPKKETKKAMEPILKSSNGPGQIIVNAELPLVDEEQLQNENEEELINPVPLKVNKEIKKPGIKLKYTVPVTERSFYAGVDNTETKVETTQKASLKERVFAYAGNQIGNLLNGESVELPKTEVKGKPQLEINLGKILN